MVDSQIVGHLSFQYYKSSRHWHTPVDGFDNKYPAYYVPVATAKYCQSVIGDSV